MRPLHDFFASSHADDRPDPSFEPAVPGGQGAAPEAPPPPVGTTPPVTLAAAAAQGQRRAAWRLLHWIGEENTDAIDAVVTFPQGRLLTLLLEWLALGTWAGKYFHVPAEMHRPSFRMKVSVLFMPGVGAPEEIVRQVLDVGLRDARPPVRATAARLLGMLADPATTPDLIEALRDPAPVVRVQAARALERLRAPEAVPALVAAFGEHDEALAGEVRHALLQLGAPAVPALLQAAGSPDAWVRWHALRVLGELRDARGLPALVNALADSDHAVAWMAARELAHMGPSVVEPLLHVLLRVPSTPWLMETAAYVLRAQRERHLKPLLAPVMRSMHSVEYRLEVPMAVERALEQLEAGGWK